MTAANTEYVLSERHVHAFGHIVLQYAKIERGFMFYLGHIMGMSIPDIAILTAPYGSRDYRNVIKSLLNKPGSSQSDAEKSQMAQFFGEFQRLGRIRNHIAHSGWIAGEKLGTVKPIGIDIRDDKPKFVGADPNETEYSLEDIEQLAAASDNLHTDMTKYFIALGMHQPKQ